MIEIDFTQSWRTSFKTSAILDKNSSLRSFINGTLFKNPTRSSNLLMAEVFMICWYAILSRVHTLTSWIAGEKENHGSVSNEVNKNRRTSLRIVAIPYLSPTPFADNCKVWPFPQKLRPARWNRLRDRFGSRRTSLHRPRTGNTL